MSLHTRRKAAVAQAVCLVAIAGLLLLAPVAARAGDPYSAYYHCNGSRLFWFMVISDIHVGASDPRTPSTSPGRSALRDRL